MVDPVPHAFSYDKYTQFFLHYDNECRQLWYIVGFFKMNNSIGKHYIAVSDSEEEICIWADMNNIILDLSQKNYGHL